MAGKTRGLTGGEIELLREVFGNAISYEKVRLRDGAGANPLARIAFMNSGNWAMTYLHTIHFNTGHFREDFSAAGENRSLLVHEATHVWQYSKLGVAHFALRYGWNFTSCHFDQHKMYDYGGAAHFDDATLEGQADMVSHYYNARKGKDGPALKAKLAGTGFYSL
jgi:hypothetical protein